MSIFLYVSQKEQEISLNSDLFRFLEGAVGLLYNSLLQSIVSEHVPVQGQAE